MVAMNLMGQKLSLIRWDRCGQTCCHGYFRLLGRRDFGTKNVSLHFGYWDGNSLLYYWCYSQDTSTSTACERTTTSLTASCVPGNGCYALHLCPLLLDGMGWVLLHSVFLADVILLLLGPLPWVYVADIFPTRTRHYGLAVASASQWLWSKFTYTTVVLSWWCVLDFVVSKVTLQMETNLGWKLFIMFATVNIGAMGTFSL